jgi:hypothetical protein
VVEYIQAYTVGRAENNAHGKAFSINEESFWMLKQRIHHDPRLVILVDAKASRLLGAQKVVVDSSKKSHVSPVGVVTSLHGHASARKSFWVGRDA